MPIVTSLLVQAIDPARLDVIRDYGTDGHGNQIHAFPASGQGEPLRCCLRFARPDEQIMLISYAPFDHPSVWTEVGPVYVHATPCGGYTPTGTLPDNTVIADDADLEPIIIGLLNQPDVATVHVRTLAPQCFLYAAVGG